MATLSASQNGDINNPSTWNGIIPTFSDILDAREFIININTPSHYSKLINTNGGYFLLSDGIGLSADIENTQNIGISGFCVLYEGTLSGSITGKIKGGNLQDRYGVYINNTNHLIVNGPVVGGYKIGVSDGGGIGIKSSINANGSLVINGDIGIEGTFTGPVSARSEFAAINSESLSDITINGNINIPSSSLVEGLQGLIVKNSSDTQLNPSVTINGNIQISDYHNYSTDMNSVIVSGVDYRGNNSVSTIPGTLLINGNISIDGNIYYYGINTTGPVNVFINGDIISGSVFGYGSIPLRIRNNRNATITLSSNSGFTGNFAGSHGWAGSWSPVRIISSDLLSINIFGDINNQLIRIGSYDSPTDAVVNSILNVQGNIKNIAGGGSIFIADFCTNFTLNIVGNVYGGTASVPSIYLRAINRTNNLKLNVYANEIIGGSLASAIVTDAYSDSNSQQNIFFNINATEIAANPSGGTGHAIQATGRYLGSFNINAERILDNFIGVTALFVRSFNLSDVPQNAIIRYAAAPFSGFGSYVIHSTINSLSAYQLPPPEAVREGVIYANGNLTGTCRIPSVSSVLLGTPVSAPDGNIGIATLDKNQLNYDAIYNAPLSAFNLKDTIGERLKSKVTPEIIGKIIESFQPVH